MRQLLLCFFFSVISLQAFSIDSLSVCSPSGKICVKIWLDGKIKYLISNGGRSLLEPSVMDMLIQGKGLLATGSRIKKVSKMSVSDQIISPVPEKRKIVPDRYNQLQIEFSKPFRVEFRVYDDGVAYRFLTAFKDSITIENEIAEFHFPDNPDVYFPQVQKREDVDIYHTSFEELYKIKPLSGILNEELAFSPVLLAPRDAAKTGITESDLEDYPGMFLSGTGGSGLRGVFAPYPLEEKLTAGEFPELVVMKRADYIARTKGSRSFPWRVLIIADEDKQLPSNDLVYRLASPSRIGDAAWVKPGKGTDEWIINVNLFHVPFRSGVNTDSYKYYIDFAKRFGFDRIMMDAGWSENADLFNINPGINMDTLVAYAKAKGVKISMWTLSYALDRQLDSALDRFNRWGIDYIMTDFIDRDDQKTVNFYYRIAKACAEHHIMIMFHGAYPPKGFNRTYPNNITRESVLGSEYNVWSDKVTPGHDLTLPFTRMLSGSFDYEPGIMNNATKNGFRQAVGMVMSQGTRCHQLAMFIVYDNPMQIFSGNPSQGLMETEFMNLLGSLPTTWDETHILMGQVGAYIVTARKKNADWYIAGMTNWTARDTTIQFNFLDPSFTYKASICRDGVNADKYAADYVISDALIRKDDSIKIHLAPGGGFLIKLERRY